MAELRGLGGTAALRLARLSGSLAHPEALEFEATVRPREVRVVLSALPAPLTISGGEVNATRGVLRLDRVEAMLLDARVTASGTVEDYRSAARRLALTEVAGAAGAETLAFIVRRLGVDPTALPRPPIALDQGRLRWSAAGGDPRSAQGTLRLAGEARAEFDVAWGPETLDVRRFALKDGYSDATGSLRWAPSRASFAFDGRVDDRSLVRVIARPGNVRARLQGNLRANIDLAEPRRSTATGALAGEGLDILERWGLPASIERVKIDATGDRARIRDSVVKVAGQRVAVRGEITIRPETFAVDLAVSAGEIDAHRLLRTLSRGDRPRPPGREAWRVPLEGRVSVTAKSIALARRAVESATATVRLSPTRVVVDVTEAALCGLSVPLNAALTPGTAMVSGRIVARDGPLDRLVPCLFPGTDVVVTGRLDADLEYAAAGPPEDLLRQVSGTVRGTGRGGRIHEKIAPQILALESVATRFEAAEARRIGARGLEYTEIAFAVALDPGRARVQHLTLDSWSLGIGMSGEIHLDDGRLSLRGVVAPFGDVTAAVRRIPLLGRLFATRIVGVPFSVTGSWHDPRVVPLGPEAIAGSLLDVLSRTLRAPIDLLSPMLDRRERAR